MKIYLIRHAQSIYNLEEQRISKIHGPTYLQSQQYLEFKYNRQYLDADITELGIQQCQGAAQIMKDIELDLVIVSPFQRALSTCYEIFKNHKSKPKVVVDPLFRQIFESVCDIGSKLVESMQRYKDWDFSEIKNPYTWYVDAIVDEQIQKRAYALLSKHPADQRNQKCAEQMLSFLKQLRQQNLRVDTEENMKKRQLKQVDKIKSQYKGLRIAVVSHSENLKHYVGIKIKNCEVREYIIDA